MKELYTAPDFTVIYFATEDNITASIDYGNDNEVGPGDFYINS